MVDSTLDTAHTDAKINVNKSSVFCRIRPAAYDGGGHDMNGEKVAKSMTNWTDKSIALDTQFMFSKGHNEYKFPTKVFGPDQS